MVGAWARFSSAFIAPCRFPYSDTDCLVTGIPTSSALLTVGSAPRSSAVAAVSSRPKAAESLRNGSWSCSDWVETSSVEGDLAIVSSSAFGLAEKAANVVAMSVNSWELTWADRGDRGGRPVELGEEATELAARIGEVGCHGL